MPTLVSVNAKEGALRRYETGGSAIRLTHIATAKEPPTDFTVRAVENFRLMPDEAFAIEPPPRPTSPPASAGRVSLAA